MASAAAATPPRAVLSLLLLLLLHPFLLPVAARAPRACLRNMTSPAAAAPRNNIPAVIVFGDSIVDPGNNNAVATIIKCNFPPYGQDFAGHVATGRFSNGKIPTDFIASRLRVKEYLPPYVGTELPPGELLTGVSFASGGTGFDPLTPSLASVLSMGDQLELFKEYKERLRAIAGDERAGSIISGSLYVVCAGSDDLANNYFLLPLGRRREYDFPAYAQFLASKASGFVEDLISLGGRSVGIVGMPPIGCVPSQRTAAGGMLRECSSDGNRMAQLYNSALEAELRRLTSKYATAGVTVDLTYIDIYTILLDMILRPGNYGFEESKRGCCGTGEIEVSVLCNSLTPVSCDDASKYVFWDSYHPTERAYQILVDWVTNKYYRYLV